MIYTCLSVICAACKFSHSFMSTSVLQPTTMHCARCCVWKIILVGFVGELSNAHIFCSLENLAACSLLAASIPTWHRQLMVPRVNKRCEITRVRYNNGYKRLQHQLHTSVNTTESTSSNICFLFTYRKSIILFFCAFHVSAFCLHACSFA